MGQVCDQGADIDTYNRLCAGPVNSATAQVNDASARDYGGWAAVGAGAATAALGVTLLITGGDPHKYDVEPSEAHARVPVVPTLWTARRGGGLGLAAAF
jgi:hypothetical protein